jgi:hypothetical protein
LFVDLLRQTREQGRVANLAGVAACCSSSIRQSSRAISIPSRAAAAIEISFAAYGIWRDIRVRVEFVGRWSRPHARSGIGSVR